MQENYPKEIEKNILKCFSGKNDYSAIDFKKIQEERKRRYCVDMGAGKKWCINCGKDVSITTNCKCVNCGKDYRIKDQSRTMYASSSGIKCKCCGSDITQRQLTSEQVVKLCWYCEDRLAVLKNDITYLRNFEGIKI